MMAWLRWRDHIEIALLALMLYAFGAAAFSRVTPAQEREIQLLAGLEQLYTMEQSHYQLEGRYFDPMDPAAGLEWQWMDGFDWEYRDTDSSFWLVVHADLDRDGRVGIWGIDSRGPGVRQLMED